MHGNEMILTHCWMCGDKKVERLEEPQLYLCLPKTYIGKKHNERGMEGDRPHFWLSPDKNILLKLKTFYDIDEFFPFNLYIFLFQCYFDVSYLHYHVICIFIYQSTVFLTSTHLHYIVVCNIGGRYVVLNVVILCIGTWVICGICLRKCSWNSFHLHL